MAIKKTIEIDVNTGDATAELDKLEGSFKDVDKAAEKTDSQLQKVGDNGGAIAVLDSVTGGMATRLRDAAEASKLFNISLKGMRTALIATGIGALVVALGIIVAYWDDIVDFITQANAKLENQLILTEAIQGTLESQVSLIDKQIELNTLQGKANEELEKQKLAILKRLQEQNVAEVRILENQLQRLKSTAVEVGFWETIKTNVAFTLFGTSALASESANLAAQRIAEIKALETQIEQAKLKAVELDITLFNLNNPDIPEGEQQPLRPQVEVNELGLTPEDAILFDSNKALNELIIKDNESFYLKQGELAARDRQFRILQEEQIKNAKITIGFQTLNILGSLAKEGSDLSKGIAASQATISTFMGINAALSATSVVPDPLGFALKLANATAVAASGFANVKNILNTKAVTTSAPNTRGVTAASAPSFNLVEGTESNQIADSISQQQEPIRAFVVSGDVTASQNLDRNIIEDSSL